MITDYHYQNLLRVVSNEGDSLETRNSLTRSCFDLERIIFTSTPLVTLRKTAWKMAIREMEWFMSGDTMCPKELLPWWEEQLGYGGAYRGGYSNQYRYSGIRSPQGKDFDQIKYLLNGLRNNPNSRRLVMTTWNPENMANITELNRNPKMPSACHGSMIQLFVRDGRVHMTHYQRSADLLLGLPHNLIQYWALLMYFARHSGLKVGSMIWTIGDAHVYSEESHTEAVKQILKCDTHPEIDNTFNLVYNQPRQNQEVPDFRASDFTMDGVIPEPKVLIRPKLL